MRRSTAPKRPKPPESLEELSHVLGHPDPALLSALIEGVNEDELRSEAKRDAPPTPKLLTEAVRLVAQAFEAWQRLSAERRNHLRGCTTEVFAIAVEQIRELENAHQGQTKRRAEQEQAKKRLETVLGQAIQLCEQSRSVLFKVAGTGQGTISALEQGIGHPTTPAEVLRSLRYVTDTSRNLVALPASNVRSRATLYGLNKAFLDAVELTLDQLRSADQKANVRPSQIPEQSVERARGLLWFLLKHISEVFVLARKVDPTLPELRRLDGAPAPAKPAEPNKTAPAKAAKAAEPEPEVRQPEVIIVPAHRPGDPIVVPTPTSDEPTQQHPAPLPSPGRGHPPVVVTPAKHVVIERVRIPVLR